MSGSKVELGTAPLLGQHSAEVLHEELGLDAEAVRCLQERGTV